MAKAKAKLKAEDVPALVALCANYRRNQPGTAVKDRLVKAGLATLACGVAVPTAAGEALAAEPPAEPAAVVEKPADK